MCRSFGEWGLPPHFHYFTFYLLIVFSFFYLLIFFFLFARSIIGH